MDTSVFGDIGGSLMLIINPVAGRKAAQRKLASFVKIFMENGYRVTTFITRKQGDAEQFASSFGRDYDLIVSVGGDGTLSETVSGVIAGGIEAPVGCIPVGSSNDFAVCHGIKTDANAAALEAATGKPKEIDVGSFGGRTFIYIAAFGAFSGLSYNTPQNLKNAFGHSAYILDAIRDLSTAKPIRMRVEADGKTYDGNYIFGAVCNITGISGVLKMPEGDVVTDDGKFEVILVREPETIEELGNVVSSILSGNFESGLIDYFHSGEITVETPGKLDWSLDGEHAESDKKVCITTLHRAAKIIIGR